MSAESGDEPFAGIHSPTFEALNDFDQASRDLYDAISNTASKTTDIPNETREQFRDMAEGVTASFNGMAVAVLEADDDLVTKAVDLKRLWFADEKERAVMLLELTSCRRHFEVPKIKHFDRIFKDLLHDAPTIDEMADEATSIYMESIEADVEDFFNHWDRNCRRGMNLSMDYEKYLRIAGKQALDVSKIASGVGIGMFIFERLGGHIS